MFYSKEFFLMTFTFLIETNFYKAYTSPPKFGDSRIFKQLLTSPVKPPKLFNFVFWEKHFMKRCAYF